MSKRIVVLIGIVILLALGISRCSSGYFTEIGEPNYRHLFGQTATLLNDGNVLIVGANTKTTEDISVDAEIYDPKSNKFYPTGKTNYGRLDHSASLLPSSNVLVTGGIDEYTSPELQDISRKAEIYNPVTGKFNLINDMNYWHWGHTSTLLHDGRVLIAGGHNWAEIYDPKTGRFSLAGKMNYKRREHTATLLKDGRVLIVGGETDGSSDARIIPYVEIYDPKTGRFSLAGNLNYKRMEHTATLLKDGRVLIAGGTDQYTSTTGAPRNPVLQAEIYDPKLGKFYPIGNINYSRLGHTAILLKNGKVLIVGGGGATTPSELFDPKKNSFIDGSNLKSYRMHHTATLLQDGTVFILGGGSPNDNKAELYVPGK